MAIPPSFNSGIPNQLMSEEEIRQYFVRNGGVVKNTDIVNYFRTYLSNPSIKDEARIIFKTYVNKLANVKVENGEKFLVLKRQYFPPIDGNGNNSSSGLPSLNSYPSTQYSQPSYNQGNYASPPGYNHHSNGPPNPSHYTHQNMNSYSGGGNAPPYGYPPPQSNNNLRRQNSQSQIYGSHYSLSSNYADPYSSQQFLNMSTPQYYQQQQQMSGLGHGHGGSTFSLASQYTTASSAGVAPYHQPSQPTLHHLQQVTMQNAHLQQQQHVQPQPQRSLSHSQQSYLMHQPVSQMHQYSQQQPLPKTNLSGYTSQVDYQLEYGLPAAPSTNTDSLQSQQQQTHRHLSPQSSGGSANNSNSRRVQPPPYRPPPPAANFGSPTGPPTAKSTGHFPHQMRRSSLSSSSMSSGVGNVRYNRSPSVPGPVSNFTSGSTQNVNSAFSESFVGPSPAFQYQRSVSVSGLPGSAQGVPATTVQQQSQSDLRSYPSDQPGNTSTGTPPPPVPPRHKRGVERSPSSVSGTSTTAKQKSGSAGGVNFGGNKHSNRRNMEIINGASSAATTGMNGMENDHEKENINLVNCTNGNFEESGGSADGDGNDELQNGDFESEHKISVKERMQKFNRIASESELAANRMPSNRNKREISSKHESVDFDTASLSSYGYGYGFSHTQLEPRAKEWMLKSAQCDYHSLNKMAQENPALVRRRDMNGYTCLHWAAKKGHSELVKLLAGTYQSDVNSKSNGGYTPLHLAAQFSKQEVYDLLVKAYNADVNIRDHSGKKPMQYLVRQDTSVSMDTFKKIKEKRRSTEMQRDRDSTNFLRIGSLNVKVKSTREAFGYLLGKSTSSSGIERMVHKNWGSADNLQEVEVNGDKDKQMMPPPSTLPHSNITKKKKTRRANEGSPPIKERSDSDSDNACGFGTDWQSP